MNEAEEKPAAQTRSSGIRIRTLLRAAVVLAIFSAGYLAGWYTTGNIQKVESTMGVLKEVHAQPDMFINPLVECNESSPGVEFTELRPFKHTVRALVDRLKQTGKISHISVYFRDLNNGPWFGIDERERFAPASLMKVPMMIACLKIAEQDREFLARKLVKKDDYDYNSMETTRPAESILPNREYPLEEVVRRMIVHSDNNALNLLIKEVDNSRIEEIYADLGITRPQDFPSEDYLTVKEYASFFRILFNASYLNREMSKKALKFLSEVEFDKGLVAGVPGEIGVVHKFGERIVKGGETSIVQIHDCGIVYYPEHPYLLCIMSRGYSLEQLTGGISEISRTVYREVDAQRREKR